MASKKPALSDKICSTPGCGKNVTARGFCIACYYRNLRQGKIESGTKSQHFRHRLSNIDVENKTADCTECGKTKIVHRGSGQYRCATEANERSKQYKRAYRASRKAELKNRCEICGTKDDLCYDHCHATGQYRGTLCKRCNVGIGFFDDNILLLNNAVSYLRRFHELLLS